MVAGKVFVRVIWFTGKDPRTRYRDCWWVVAIGDTPRRAGRESALGGFRQGIESAIPALRRYARALTRNVELADDLVQDTLVRALASLVEDQRTALLLVVLEGLTYREVAEVQAVPIGTVMSRLARARMQIKAYLDGERPALRRIK